jgi:hypothetical protein
MWGEKDGMIARRTQDRCCPIKTVRETAAQEQPSELH